MTHPKTPWTSATAPDQGSLRNPGSDAAYRGGLPLLDLQKNARERLRVTHTTFKGKPYIDLRIWYVDGGGDYQPSRSGVSIRPDHLAEVLRALTLAGREVSQGGI